jgi:hypothetical protein
MQHLEVSGSVRPLIRVVRRQSVKALEKKDITDFLRCWKLTFGTGDFFLILAHILYINVNNTGTKYVRIMKQTAF